MNAMGRLIICAVLLSGCGPSQSGRMTAEQPPSDWMQVLLEDRQEKDLSFRDSPESPIPAESREGFSGLIYWEPDPGWRYVGTLHRYPTVSRFSIMTTTGKVRPCARVGWLAFIRDGVAQNLQIYRLLDNPEPTDPTEWFLPFVDATNGGETYAAGRYLDLERLEDGRFVLDFNRAYNPFCAYGDAERFACPVPPKENRLRIPVPAGEQLPQEPSH